MTKIPKPFVALLIGAAAFLEFCVINNSKAEGISDKEFVLSVSLPTLIGMKTNFGDKKNVINC